MAAPRRRTRTSEGGGSGDGDAAGVFGVASPASACGAREDGWRALAGAPNGGRMGAESAPSGGVGAVGVRRRSAAGGVPIMVRSEEALVVEALPPLVQTPPPMAAMHGPLGV